MGKTIVLAHGLFGFGAPPFGLPSLFSYFNGVAGFLHALGHQIFEPQVNPIGSIAQRGNALADAIREAASETRQPVHVIAHSMGGLDARHAITNVLHGGPVRTLITVGTPHLGSPVADAIRNPADPLFEHIPDIVRRPLEENAGAVHELTTQFCRNFDATTHDVDGVRYIEVAGDASRGGRELLLFDFAAAIGKIKGEINDGVVTRSSALRLRNDILRPALVDLPDWPGDHASEIGWTLPPGLGHLERFRALVALLQ